MSKYYNINEESKVKKPEEGNNQDFKSYELLQNFRLKNHDSQEAYLNNDQSLINSTMTNQTKLMNVEEFEVVKGQIEMSSTEDPLLMDTVNHTDYLNNTASREFHENNEQLK